jgi:alpha/beta superfamily hydrolase
MARKIESHWIAGPAGRLEAILEEPEHDEPRFAALVCHPHPQHGGTMHNKVVYRLARGLRRAGGVTVRFNYRGVNLSEGSYAHGIGEIEDARASLQWLLERYPSLPYALAGFSFGARIVQKLGCAAAGCRLIVAAGFPTRYLEEESFAACAAPRVFVQSTNDEFGPRAELQAFVDTLDRRPDVHWIDAGDHFFAGALEGLEEAVQTVCASIDLRD